MARRRIAPGFTVDVTRNQFLNVPRRPVPQPGRAVRQAQIPTAQGQTTRDTRLVEGRRTAPGFGATVTTPRPRPAPAPTRTAGGLKTPSSQLNQRIGDLLKGKEGKVLEAEINRIGKVVGGKFDLNRSPTFRAGAARHAAFQEQGRIPADVGNRIAASVKAIAGESVQDRATRVQREFDEIVGGLNEQQRQAIEARPEVRQARRVIEAGGLAGKRAAGKAAVTAKGKAETAFKTEAGKIRTVKADLNRKRELFEAGAKKARERGVPEETITAERDLFEADLKQEGVALEEKRIAKSQKRTDLLTKELQKLTDKRAPRAQVDAAKERREKSLAGLDANDPRQFDVIMRPQAKPLTLGQKQGLVRGGVLGIVGGVERRLQGDKNLTKGDEGFESALAFANKRLRDAGLDELEEDDAVPAVVTLTHPKLYEAADEDAAKTEALKDRYVAQTKEWSLLGIHKSEYARLWASILLKAEIDQRQGFQDASKLWEGTPLGQKQAKEIEKARARADDQAAVITGMKHEDLAALLELGPDSPGFDIVMAEAQRRTGQA